MRQNLARTRVCHGMVGRLSMSVAFSMRWGQLGDHMGEGGSEHASATVLDALEKTFSGRSTDLSQLWHHPVVTTCLL